MSVIKMKNVNKIRRYCFKTALLYVSFMTPFYELFFL